MSNDNIIHIFGSQQDQEKGDDGLSQVPSESGNLLANDQTDTSVDISLPDERDGVQSITANILDTQNNFDVPDGNKITYLNDKKEKTLEQEINECILSIIPTGIADVQGVFEELQGRARTIAWVCDELTEYGNEFILELIRDILQLQANAIYSNLHTVDESEDMSEDLVLIDEDHEDDILSNDTTISEIIQDISIKATKRFKSDYNRHVKENFGLIQGDMIRDSYIIIEVFEYLNRYEQPPYDIDEVYDTVEQYLSGYEDSLYMSLLDGAGLITSE